MAKLRAAVVTDIHYGFNHKAKLGSKGPRLMDKFIRAVNDNAPDMIVDMGDRFTAREAAQDKILAQQVKDHFNQAAAPTHHILGNHDVKFMSRADNELVTGSPARNWSMDQGGYHIVFFNPGADAGNDLTVGQSDLDWLAADLAATDKPAIVFSHIPLDNNCEEQMELHPDHRALHARFGYPVMGAKIRDIMEKSNKVVLCMSGHVHVDMHREINGIHYVTLQSLTHAHKKKGKVPRGAWAWLDLEDDKIEIHVQGKIKRDYCLTPRPVS